VHDLDLLIWLLILDACPRLGNTRSARVDPGIEAVHANSMQESD
jgi:hypothetical protein